MSTKIEWTNETQNPIIGCSKISEGCQNCYAENFAKRLVNNPNPKVSERYMNIISPNGWTGKTQFVNPELEKPRMIFVCSMGDLFHESVSFEQIDHVMTVIALNPQNIAMVLTKRPERMKEYFESRNDWNDYLPEIAHDYLHMFSYCLPKVWFWDECYDQDGEGNIYTDKNLVYDSEVIENLWLGVTAENQKTADERIPVLLQIPAKVRFVSCEPLLENLILDSRYLTGWCNIHDFESGGCIKANGRTDYKGCDLSKINWVIAGPETGPVKRAMKREWIESLYNQCDIAEVPFFDKKNILGKNIQQFPNI